MTVAHYLGLTPKWVDGTAVGGCSFMIHVRHAAAAIASGLYEMVLITHRESGRSGVGRTRNVVSPASLADQYEQPYGPMGRRLCSRSQSALHDISRRPRESGGPGASDGAPDPWVPACAGTTKSKHKQLAMVSVVQREWAAKNPRATFKTPTLPAPRAGAWR